MITFLKGNLAYKGESPAGGVYLVVDVGGVGYQVMTNAPSYLQAPALNEPILVHTSLIVREDLMQLVGFLSREERDLFDILGTASGVGAKVALALMSELSVSELAAAIMSGNHKRLTSAKGVGPKLAQKIAIELKDKMSKWRNEKVDLHHYDMDDTLGTKTPAFEEAETVLLSLGYSMEEVYQGLRHIQSASEQAETLTSEEVLQQVLKYLATHPVK